MAANIIWPRLIQLRTNKLIQSVPSSSIFIQHCLMREKRSFKLRVFYGDSPLLTSDQYEAAKEANQLEDLSFRPIRFAKIDENNSLLYDPNFEVFVRNSMRDGRKEMIESLMRETFYLIKSYQYRRKLRKDQADDAIDKQEEEEIITDPMEVYKRAIENCKPLVITKKIKRGGAIYQVPFPLDAKQSEWFSMKWIIQAVLERSRPKKKRFFEAMAQELLDASQNRGKVIKRRDDIHKLAEANKAYSHYRWG